MSLRTLPQAGPGAPTGSPAAAPAPAGPRRASVSRTKRRRGLRELPAALLFVGPAAFGFVVFYLWPTITGIFYSFTNYNLLTDPKTVGLANYEKMMTDPNFWSSLRVTAIYVVLVVVFQILASLLIAALMQQVTRSVAVRGIILLPFLVSGVVAALTWFWMLDFQSGIINAALEAFGIDRIAFFGDTATALPTVAFLTVWRGMGYNALLIFAGMLTIPNDVYEAAALDGAARWRQFWQVTIPLIRPVLAMVLVLTVISAFQTFDIVAVTTKGGPIGSTKLLSYYIYELAFSRSKFGYASAISVALLVVLAVLSFVQIRMMRANKSDLA